MSKEGADVYVILLTRLVDPLLLKELECHAKVVFLDQIKKKYYPCFKNGKPTLNLLVPVDSAKFHALLGDTFDCIHAADTTSLIYASYITRFVNTPVLTVGVYHDLEYDYRAISRYKYGKILETLFSSIPSKNVWLIYDHSRSMLERIYNKKFNDAMLFPIGVDLDRFPERQEHVKSNCLVSVGRLVPFKTYNKQVIIAVHKLKLKNIFLYYHIYGTGECEKELRCLVESLNIQDLVIFHGSINYSEFPKMISNYLCFIGSGTAVIEASSAGVPAIVGLEDDQVGETYGFLHQTQEFSYHSIGLNYPTTTIMERIEYMVSCSDGDYRRECELARARAMEFSMSKTVSILGQQLDQFLHQDYSISRSRIFAFIGNLLWHYVTNRQQVKKDYFGRHTAN